MTKLKKGTRYATIKSHDGKKVPVYDVVFVKGDGTTFKLVSVGENKTEVKRSFDKALKGVKDGTRVKKITRAVEKI